MEYCRNQEKRHSALSRIEGCAAVREQTATLGNGVRIPHLPPFADDHVQVAGLSFRRRGVAEEHGHHRQIRASAMN
jgi:hypothetical protein